MITELYDNLDAFYDRVYSFLVEREAENNLIFSILNTLKLNIHTYGEQLPFLSLVKRDEKVELVAIQTPPFDLVLSYTNNLRCIENLVATLIQRNIELPGILGPKNAVKKFIDLWSCNKDLKSKLKSNERIYILTEVSEDTLGKRKVIQSSKDYQSLIIHMAEDFMKEAFPESFEVQIKNLEKRLKPDIEQGRFFLLLENEQVVSMARKAGETPNGNLINYVYTPPAFRKKGFATECVAYLSKYILDEGNQFCFLFTDLANQTSNSIYQRIGYNPVIDIDQYEFIPKL